MHDAAPPRLYLPGPHKSAVALVELAGHAYPGAQLPLHAADVSPASDPYVPPGHGAHDPAPPSLYVPAVHNTEIGLVDPAAHAYPGKQESEHAADVRPGAAPYRPARHGPLHAAVVRPGDDPYRPAAHRLQTAAPDTLNVPTGQIDAVALVEPKSQAYPATQLPLHAADVSPATDPYLPPGHGVHDPAPPSLYVPATHRAAVGVVDPATHACPAEHGPEHAADGRPGDAPYRPAGHGPLHAAVVRPGDAPYKPAAHMLQAAAPPRLNVPPGHMKVVALVDPAGHAYPAEQAPEHVHDVRPGAAPYRPPGHGAEQDATVNPGVNPYRPAAHRLQTAAPDTLNVPTGQIDAVALVEPKSQAYPATQLPLHAADVSPATDPYLPPGHGVHDPAPPSLYVPATHRAAVGVVDPATHACPAEHGPEHAADGRPGDAPYRPAGQGPLHAAVVRPGDAPYKPTGHDAVHNADVSPELTPYKPAPHKVHDAAPPRLYVPGPHKSAEALVEPAGHANPGAQLPLQAADVRPAIDPNEPPGHCAQVPAPPTLNVPGGHIMAVALVDPATHAYPAAQLPLHAAEVKPVTDPNVPAGQGVQAPRPPALNKPMGHTEAAAVVDPSTQKYPAEQLPLHAAVVNPVTDPYLPAGHTVQDPKPPPLYLPGLHRAQETAPARLY